MYAYFRAYLVLFIHMRDKPNYPSQTNWRQLSPPFWEPFRKYGMQLLVCGTSIILFLLSFAFLRYGSLKCILITRCVVSFLFLFTALLCCETERVNQFKVRWRLDEHTSMGRDLNVGVAHSAQLVGKLALIHTQRFICKSGQLE